MARVQPPNKMVADQFDNFAQVAAMAKAAVVVALTDSTTGTANDTVSDVGGAFNQATLNNNFADLAAKINAILTALKNAGLMATS